MNALIDQGKEQVAKLCQYFTINRQAFLAPGVKEAHVRQSLIDPFFEALGWDVGNKSMIAPQYREVIPEDSLDIEGHQKAPDYTFRVGSQPKFYAEAKRCGVNIGADAAPAFQLRRYGWSAKLALSILTDFEELGVYDCTLRPRPNEKASHARIQYLHFEEYPDRWRELWDVFSREAVWSGAFDQYAASKRKRGTSEVDVEFLKEMEGWRLALAGNIALRNKGLSLDELNAAVQLTIDRVVFLRMAEDRGLEPYEQLLRLCERPDVYPRFMHDLSRRADQKYNSGLFHFQKEKSVSEDPDRITPKLAVDDKIFKPILQSLYFAHGSPYHFGVLPVEILGTVYERFLGKVIRLTAGHQAKIEEKPEVRKAGGVYYTPAYIVEYIVKNTVARQIEGRSPAQLAGSKDKPPFRALDMACGSGSFLLGAYQYLLDYCFNWYVEHKPENYKKAVYKDARDGHWRLTIEEKKRILTTHIFGVDIDRQAVEVTKLSLLLKVLEGETDQSLSLSQLPFGDRALPNLADNIKCGNSLIGSDYFIDKLFVDPAELKRINPFDWKLHFPDPMKADGFDCVIGNPPYVQIENILRFERDYFMRVYGENGKLGKRWDLYQVFVLRALLLLRPQGRFGYILPNTFLMGQSYRVLRKRICEAACVEECVDLPQGVFHGVTIDNVLLFLRREPDAKKRAMHLLQVCKLLPKSDKSRIGSRTWDESFEIIQSSLTDADNYVLNIHTNPRQAALFSKFEAVSVQLGDVTESSQGIILYKTEADARKSKYTGTTRKAGWKKLLRGTNIGRYETKWGHEYVHYGDWLWCQRDEKFFARPKILLQALRNKSLRRRLVATYDVGRYYNAHNLANIIAKEGSSYDLRYVLGCFNSTLLNFWYKAHFPNVNINPNDFRHLPLRRIDFNDPADKARHDKVLVLVDSMLALHKQLAAAKSAAQKAIMQRQIDATDAEIDRLIYDLYGLTAEEIALIENSAS